MKINTKHKLVLFAVQIQEMQPLWIVAIMYLTILIN